MHNSDKPSPRPPVSAVKWIIRLSVTAIVVWGVWRTVAKALQEIAAQPFSLGQIDLGWLAAAGLVYLLGMAPAWLFWRRAMIAMGQRPGVWASLRAFYIGHLGKYVPGKAMVVVLRTGLVRGPKVDTAVAAVSVFVETLTMMAVGGLVAAVILAVYYAHHLQLLLLAVALMACAGGPTLPPIFRRIVRVVARRRWTGAELEAALHGVTFRLMAWGWGCMTVTWMTFGLSLWATLLALGEASPTWEHYPLMTATVSLALVAGFLSLLPGGVGVREAVVMALLAPTFGELAALVSAVLLRLAWLAAELVASALLSLSATSVLGPNDGH